ncbi:MAG: LPXTG cell wall anchor domain-containing protein, partial [Firmicutes bacterium]|nr:LPXTG cell wall anchor domain-containing protein [Bacillota bacterium]
VLPSTGGIGTTIFYIVGGILVIGAGVILVARKRSSSK